MLEQWRAATAAAAVTAAAAAAAAALQVPDADEPVAALRDDAAAAERVDPNQRLAAVSGERDDTPVRPQAPRAELTVAGARE